MALSVGPGDVRILEGGFRQLTRGRLSPIGRDLERRSLRVTRRMKLLATGVGGGPRVRSGNLQSAIGYLRAGEDSHGMYADVGPQPARMTRRGYNYALILEGVFPRGGAPPDGARPFLAKSLEAFRD